jgi:hypothetical protein
VPAFSNCSKPDVLRCSRRLIISKVFMGVSVESGECEELSTWIFVLTPERRAGFNAQFVSCAETISKDPAKPHRKSHWKAALLLDVDNGESFAEDISAIALSKQIAPYSLSCVACARLFLFPCSLRK